MSGPPAEPPTPIPASRETNHKKLVGGKPFMYIENVCQLTIKSF